MKLSFSLVAALFLFSAHAQARMLIKDLASTIKYTPECQAIQNDQLMDIKYIPSQWTTVAAVLHAKKHFENTVQISLNKQTTMMQINVGGELGLVHLDGYEGNIIYGDPKDPNYHGTLLCPFERYQDECLGVSNDLKSELNRVASSLDEKIPAQKAKKQVVTCAIEVLDTWWHFLDQYYTPSHSPSAQPRFIYIPKEMHNEEPQ